MTAEYGRSLIGLVKPASDSKSASMWTQEELAARAVVSFSIGRPDDAKIVWLRASGVRRKLIAWQLGMNRTTAWQRWVAALMSIAPRLNGVVAQPYGRPA